jgi:DNA-binding NarL/FixJ family response regulator
MLAAAEEVEVVGEAASGDDITDEEELQEADVVLVAGDREDLEAVPISEEGQTALVALVEEELVSVLEAMPLRGWGLLPPDASGEEISASLVAASRGLVVLPRYPNERLPRSVTGIDEHHEALTPREAEILELIGRGLSNRLMAQELHISEHTVKFHISSLYAKLGVTNRAGAVSQGARRGWISL